MPHLLAGEIQKTRSSNYKIKNEIMIFSEINSLRLSQHRMSNHVFAKL
jgi:hypothetical protein